MKRLAIYGLVLVSLIVTAAIYAADKTVNVKGEVVDTMCYASMGAKGEGHAKCGMTCAAKGMPVGLVEGSKMYILLPPKDGTGLPKAVTEKMGKEVTVTGKVYTAGGNTFLTVDSVK
ncbi:MAG TPA: hypothetical protein VG323_00930 [Thermoanaerobaculia bacterium]|nr:hypothetical protein [Thermoanaerobaculia bacterium]